MQGLGINTSAEMLSRESCIKLRLRFRRRSRNEDSKPASVIIYFNEPFLGSKMAMVPYEFQLRGFCQQHLIETPTYAKWNGWLEGSEGGLLQERD